MPALRKTVAVLARLGTGFQAERAAERAKRAAAPEEVEAARLSPGLIKKLRSRLGITQGELATLVGVSTSAVGSWEQRQAGREAAMRRMTILELVAAAGVFAVALVVGVMIYSGQPAPPVPRKTVPAERGADLKAARSQGRHVAPPVMRLPPQERPAPEAPGDFVADTRQAPPAKRPDRAIPDKRPPAAQPARPGAGKPPARNPEARDALSRVGFDPAAEVVWLRAINDPDLPPEERKDLIEDLNEDGFPDPGNVTEADLPLILSRMELIEQLWPGAMDEVNEAAFREAYKDLVNMYIRLGGP